MNAQCSGRNGATQIVQHHRYSIPGINRSGIRDIRATARPGEGTGKIRQRTIDEDLGLQRVRRIDTSRKHRHCQVLQSSPEGIGKPTTVVGVYPLLQVG